MTDASNTQLRSLVERAVSLKTTIADINADLADRADTTIKNNLPSQAYLVECLSYDQDTGEFIWKNRPLAHFSSEKACNVFNNKIAGNRAGYSHNGYRYIGIGGVDYPAHRIAWKIVNGRDPINDIDHKNCNKADNRIANLRQASRSQNSSNGLLRKTNKSGFKGVSRKGGIFVSQISKNGKVMHLGCFKTAEEAAQCYRVAASKFHGDFAREK
jgi:hypothetical protein